MRSKLKCLKTCPRQRRGGTLTVILVLKTDDLSCANQKQRKDFFFSFSHSRISLSRSSWSTVLIRSYLGLKKIHPM